MEIQLIRSNKNTSLYDDYRLIMKLSEIKPNLIDEALRSNKIFYSISDGSKLFISSKQTEISKSKQAYTFKERHIIEL